MGTLETLFTSIENKTDEELKEMLLTVRQRRDVIKPAARKRIEKIQDKENKKTINKAAELLAALSPEELEILMKGLEK
jgi:hypothetical protein